MKKVRPRQLLLVLLLLVGYISAQGQGPGKAGSVGYVDPPKTGNVAADEKAHMEAKTKWIQANPEAYRAAGGNPEEALKPKEEAVKPVTLPAFRYDHSFVLSLVEAVAAPGAKPASAALADETRGLQQEFPVGKTELQLQNSGSLRLLIGSKADLRGLEVRNGNAATWTFKRDDCEGCTKVLTLRIESSTPGRIVYVMDSEDSEADMAYRFVFDVKGTN